MHNTFSIETEAAFRRAEWQRAVNADALASQATARMPKPRRFQLPHLSFPGLRSLATARLPFSSPAQRRGAAIMPRPADC